MFGVFSQNYLSSSSHAVIGFSKQKPCGPNPRSLLFHVEVFKTLIEVLKLLKIKDISWFEQLLKFVFDSSRVGNLAVS